MIRSILNALTSKNITDVETDRELDKVEYEVTYKEIKEAEDMLHKLTQAYLKERGWVYKDGMSGYGWFHPSLGWEIYDFKAIKRWRQVHEDA